MYQKYQTDALVLRNYERGEADRVFALFTQEFGLLWARCSAIRRESSRMRYALQNYAHVRASLVRGAGGWRLAGAAALSEGMDLPGATAFARISNLVDRLVAGEEKNPYLYQTLIEARTALKDASGQANSAVELLCVARILFSLGYLSADAVGTALFAHTAFASDEITKAEELRPQLLSSVNKALAETQL